MLDTTTDWIIARRATAQIIQIQIKCILSMHSVFHAYLAEFGSLRLRHDDHQAKLTGSMPMDSTGCFFVGNDDNAICITSQTNTNVAVVVFAPSWYYFMELKQLFTRQETPISL